MRLIDADKGLISKIQRETGCNFITAQKIVDSMPTVEERKVGKWITKDGREQGYDIAGIKTWYKQIMCNKCGFIKTALEGYAGQRNYCPNCGAEMRGNENEED